MKVLYLSNATGADYQCDMLFHGLRSLLGADCVDVNKMLFMYRGQQEPFYSIYGLLEDIPVDREDIVSKIQAHYFDAVIYGSIQRCQSHFDLVRALYPRHKIALIDGEDDHVISPLRGHGLYFKRELAIPDADMLPIQFAIPFEKVRSMPHGKDRVFAECDPRDRTTYKFYDGEEGYYDQYSRAYFGYTMKKGGWDCCRHYEIMAAGCLPYFAGLEDCPTRTMSWLPKSLLLEARSLADNWKGDYNYWSNIMVQVQMHLAKNLTTGACAARVLERLL